MELAELAYQRGEKPMLRGHDLSGLGLYRAQLLEADLSEANLRQVDLSSADLNGANLSRSELPEANLARASLRGANLSQANLFQANHPPVYVIGRKPGTDVFRPRRHHPDDETFPGLLLVRTEGRIYFANAQRVGEKAQALIQQEQPQAIVIDCSAIPDIEYTALKQLTELEERLRGTGIMLWLAALNPEPLRTVQQSSLGEVLGHERMFFNLEQAVTTYVAGTTDDEPQE